MKRRLLPALLPLALVACSQKGIEGLKTFDYSGGDERSGSLLYAETPPVGGPHNALWQTCGVYDRPLYNEYAVHSLAHGAVWITYRPDLGPEGVAALRQLLNGYPATLLSPYPGLPAPVVVSAWNAQLAVDDPGDGRLKAFLDRYGQGETAPERGAPCSGGYGGTR